MYTCMYVYINLWLFYYRILHYIKVDIWKYNTWAEKSGLERKTCFQKNYKIVFFYFQYKYLRIFPNKIDRDMSVETKESVLRMCNIKFTLVYNIIGIITGHYNARSLTLKCFEQSLANVSTKVHLYNTYIYILKLYLVVMLLGQCL